MGNSDHFAEETAKFEVYYQKNESKFKYWLSPALVRDIDKEWFQAKLLSLKL